jgi:hypothetical protein
MQSKIDQGRRNPPLRSERAEVAAAVSAGPTSAYEWDGVYSALAFSVTPSKGAFILDVAIPTATEIVYRTGGRDRAAIDAFAAVIDIALGLAVRAPHVEPEVARDNAAGVLHFAATLRNRMGEAESGVLAQIRAEGFGIDPLEKAALLSKSEAIKGCLQSMADRITDGLTQAIGALEIDAMRHGMRSHGMTPLLKVH